MYRKRVTWILLMAVLCLVLYTVVRSRAENKTDVILGGVDGGIISSDSVSFTALNATPTPEPTEDIWPDIDITLTQYSLIYSGNLLSSSYQPDVSEIPGTDYHMMFDSAALPHLEEMLDDLRSEGFGVYVGSAYRSYSYQKQLFDGKAYNIALEMGIKGDEIWLLPEYQDAVAGGGKPESIIVAKLQERIHGLCLASAPDKAQILLLQEDLRIYEEYLN